MIVIIDYGVGNTGSIKNMLKKIGVDVTISSDLDTLLSASKLILPGVGSFDNAMSKLHNLGMVELLNQKVIIEKTPFLGICLGMQLLAKHSEEGSLKGLGWIDATVEKFNLSNYKVPHMGWNIPHIKKASALSTNLPGESRFYFVHSYFFKPGNEKDILMTADYGRSFVAAIEHENILGVQFHPEKSHVFGLALLKNFVENY